MRPTAELVEMACCDECCGFAGSFAFKQPGVFSAILNRKLVHIEQTGAQIVATDCPGCIMQLQSGLLDRCAIELRHTAELIADVLKK
ncbi:MAG: (Fe-S)-binding protein [Armatimonadetes bacterium]|nr:(Fe-S)-binding protein [Armatimonadota bacterium]